MAPTTTASDSLRKKNEHVSTCVLCDCLSNLRESLSLTRAVCNVHELFHEFGGIVSRMVTSGCGHQNKQRIDLSDSRKLKNSHTSQHK